MTKKTVLIVAVLLAAGVAVLVVAGEDDWDAPEPEIESVEVTSAGCHDDVRGMSMSSTNGTWISTVNGTSPHTVVSAEIRLVSPERAEITTYRIDSETHNTSAPAPDHDCSADEGAIVYEIEYDAPYDGTGTGLRVERYLDGELKGCGGSTSGPDLGCARLHEDVPTHWSNETR